MDFRPVRAAAYLLAAGFAGSASAHPVDEVVQGAYLTIAQGRLRLQLEITPGSAVSGVVIDAMDADHNGVLTRGEKRIYALRVLRQCALSIDGKPVKLHFDQIGVPAYAMLRQQAGTIQLFAQAPTNNDEQAHTFAFRNAYQPSRGPTTANVFVEPSARDVTITGIRRSNDGRSFVFTVSKKGIDPS